MTVMRFGDPGDILRSHLNSNFFDDARFTETIADIL